MNVQLIIIMSRSKFLDKITIKKSRSKFLNKITIKKVCSSNIFFHSV